MRQSPHSVMVIRSMRLHQPVNVSGKRSAMPPGLQPEAWKLTPPFLQAFGADRGGHLRILDEGEPVGAGRDDVLPGLQQAAHLAEIPGQRAVEHAVGVEAP